MTAIGYLGGSSSGTVTFNNIASSANTRTTIRMRYTNGDTTQRFANLVVNGQSQRVAFVPSANGQTTGVASFQVSLNSGGSNSVRVEGINGGWGEFTPILITCCGGCQANPSVLQLLM